MSQHALVWSVLIALTAARLPAAETPATVLNDLGHLQGEMVGEVTATTAILQSRLTGSAIAADGDVPGASGAACFEIADNAEFQDAWRTDWLEAVAERDFIVKTRLSGLKPATRYWYRLIFGRNRQQTSAGPPRRFATLAGADRAVEVKFVVVTGMNYAFFHDGPQRNSRRAYQGPDKHLGFPALAAILQHRPDFFVGTGDNVYYDHHADQAAKTAAQLRRKWHEQFVQPRFVDLFASVPTYWEKDDHDHRYNDCDTTGNREPSSELGIAIFKEQVPVTDPADAAAVTYRTHRISRDLQIWLLEGRDYRSPNRSPDGPDKTIWGQEQREWLQQTLLASDATFRIIISPTPLVGPDDLSKRDNHTNRDGFRHEGDAFFAWAQQHRLHQNGVALICGDRHWQYLSIHPSGMEEYACGALVEANARMGVNPGSPKSTDPQGLIQQPYTSPRPAGGFLEVTVIPAAGGSQPPEIHFDFYDEQGEGLYRTVRRR